MLRNDTSADTFSLYFSLSSFFSSHHLITSAFFHSLLCYPSIRHSLILSPLSLLSTFPHASCSGKDISAVAGSLLSLHLIISHSFSLYQVSWSRTVCFLSPLPSSIFLLPSSSIISPSFLHSHVFGDDASAASSSLTAVLSSSFLPSPLHPVLLSSFSSLHPLLHTSQTCHNVTSNTSLTKPHLHNQLAWKLSSPPLSVIPSSFVIPPHRSEAGG